MTETKIYLVRHAEVENPKGIYYVWLPRFGLSKNGYFQARRLKDYFRTKSIKKIYSSPLLRARKTAGIISDKRIKVFLTRKIIEANYSHWQGISISSRPLKELRTYINRPDEAKFLGEPIKKVQKRVVRFIEKIIKNHPGDNIILVSHADPIISARLYYEGRNINDVNKISLKNASITLLVFRDGKCVKVEYREIVPAKEDGA